MFKDIDRIKNIIEHVRIFSRDQQKIRSDEVDVRLVMNDAMSMVRKMLETENVVIGETDSEEEIIVLGNRHQLEQVFLNLFSNARYAVNEKERKYPNSGYVKQIEISCNKKGKHLVLEIRDNGIGMPPEVLTNIFNPFFTTKSETKGTGLGLSISYGIIQQMEGEITAESVEDQYTIMRIKLPLVKKFN